MRNSKAKTLRRLATNLNGGDKFTTYTQQVHKARMVPTGRLNEKGEMLMAKYVPTTVRLDNSCTRAVYQGLKKVGA